MFNPYEFAPQTRSKRMRQHLILSLIAGALIVLVLAVFGRTMYHSFSDWEVPDPDEETEFVEGWLAFKRHIGATILTYNQWVPLNIAGGALAVAFLLIAVAETRKRTPDSRIFRISFAPMVIALVWMLHYQLGHKGEPAFLVVNVPAAVFCMLVVQCVLGGVVSLAVHRRAKRLFAEGADALRHRNHALSVAKIESGLAFKPGDIDALIDLGRAHRHEKRSDEALTAFKTALKQIESRARRAAWKKKAATVKGSITQLEKVIEAEKKPGAKPGLIGKLEKVILDDLFAFITKHAGKLSDKADKVSSTSYFLLAAMFLVTWIWPKWLGEAMVGYLLFVMFMEFILIHATGFLGFIVMGDETRSRKLVGIFGMGAMYVLLMVTFAMTYGSWQPVLAFCWLIFTKFVCPVLGSEHCRKKKYFNTGWAVSFISLFIVLLTSQIPVPRFGMTGEYTANLPFPGGDQWLADPHRVMFAGLLYFIILGVFELYRDRIMVGGKIVLSKEKKEKLQALVSVVLIGAVAAMGISECGRRVTREALVRESPPDRILTGFSDAVYAVAFSPDGTRLAAGSRDGGLKTWSTTNWTEIVSVVAGEINSLAFLPDGKTIVTGNWSLNFWDAESGNRKLVIRGLHKRKDREPAVSPSGAILATLGMGDDIRLWDLNTGELLPPITIGDDTPGGIAWSPDGSLLAVHFRPAEDMTLGTPIVALVDMETRSVTHLGRHRDFVRHMVFSPDGERLVTCSDDKTVRIWSVEKKEQIAVQTDFEDAVYAVALSPDGCLIAAGSGGWGSEDDYSFGAVKIWDPETGRSVDLGTPATVWSVAFSPDGNTLAAGCGNASGPSSKKNAEVRLWDIARVRADLAAGTMPDATRQ